MDLEVTSSSGICRTCKCIRPQMWSVFENYETLSPRIDEMLMACASVQVTYGDGLPSQICEACVEQLKSAFVFKRQCEKIDATLRESLKNYQQVGEIKEEIQNSEFVESLNTLSNLLNEQQQSNSKETTPDGTSTLVTPKVVTDYIQFMDNNQMLLTCCECGKMFTTLEGLRCHKRLHIGGMYKCEQCDKEYTRLNHLQRHEQMHVKRKVHVCKICNKSLMRKEDLKRHLVTHLREKPFSCKTCNRGFNRVDHLQKHVPRCKGDTVYPCDICNRAFNREDSLEVHKQVHGDEHPKILTVDSLENILEHYYQMDHDGDATFSDHSDIDDCFEPQVEVRESMDEEKIKEVANIANADDDTNMSEISGPGKLDDDGSSDNEVNEGLDFVEAENKLEVKETVVSVADEDDDDFDVGSEEIDDNSGDSTDSEYLPKKSLSSKSKRGRGNASKNSTTSPKTEVDDKDSPSTKRVKKEEDEDYGEFPCPTCNQKFPTVSQLNRHAKQKHKGLKVHKCSECHKVFSRADHLKRHLMSHSAIKPFNCTVCTKSFNRRDHLNHHQKLHERQNDFECDVCHKPFNRADLLAKHKATEHGIGERIMGEKKYQCPLCLKAFTTEKYRDVHVNGHSTKDFQCEVCEKTYLSKSQLTEHTKSHDELAKKFLCSECGRRFIKNDYLVIHMRRHRGEKPFKCKYCGKGFPRTTDLTIHERYHTGEKPHLCTICGKGFGRSYNLKVHIRTHTKEKPYQCTYCDAAFAQGNDLKAHVRRHTGERFQCELCTDNFLMGYLLTQHKRTVHGLNVLSNIRRLQPIDKQEENPDEPPPIIMPLPKPVVPEHIML